MQNEDRGQTPIPPRGWFYRGYLPHLDVPEVWQFVTFRLADSLPKTVVTHWKRELRDDPDSERRLMKRVDRYLDEGHGTCVLRHPKHAALVEGALLHFHDERYALAAWVIMPNHVHAVVQQRDGWALGECVASWKRFSASRINQSLGQKGRLWQVDYFDRYVRDEGHFLRVVAYVHENPVRAGLVSKPELWRFSSARVMENDKKKP